MAIKNVEIKITNLDAANRLGAGNKIVPEHLAKEYERRGWARIVNAFPSANPEPTPKDIEEEATPDKKVVMPEEAMLTKGCYLGSDDVFKERFLEEGNGYGYKVSSMSPEDFSPGKLLLNGFVVYSSNINDFTKKQLTDIRAVLFQKRIPFVFRVDVLPDIGPEMGYDRPLRQSFILALFTSFKDESVMSEAIARYGELIGSDWMVEADAEPGEFWKLLSKQMNKFQKYVRELK